MLNTGVERVVGVFEDIPFRQYRRFQGGPNARATGDVVIIVVQHMNLSEAHTRVTGFGLLENIEHIGHFQIVAGFVFRVACPNQ